ncbi:O-antigen ligase [Streptomyces sp. FIT100]|uniref:O-antigen ligase family protein n=1 Tax=Streptomyces sp. FIT100 TaxID=2837956 RepID=UPI0021C8A0CA|nr:O-antigen ligase family protein [Streptomyces sp. FIT100]UUN25310.1 O-antigen ligase family protein [Streptomyces sp. FIT100]
MAATAGWSSNTSATGIDTTDTNSDASAPVRDGEQQERGHAADVVGVAVLGCSAAWALISAAGRDARPEGVLLAVLAVAAGYACGRICGGLLPVTAAAAAALGGLGLALASPHGLPGLHDVPGGPLPQPGSSGAAAALLVLAAGAACCAASAARPGAIRLALWLLAVGVVGTSLLLGSVVGSAAAVGVLLCSLAAAHVRRRLMGLAGFALATALVTAGAWAMAEDTLPHGLTVSLQDRLTEHRVRLWQDAAGIAEEYPVLGAGPGRFGELSPTVQQSPDPDGTPRSAPLQLAAEQGVVGVVLLGGLYVWMLYGLGRSSRSTAVALSAGAALTAVGVLASVGDCLSHTAVTAGAGLLAGLATARTASGPDGSARHLD